jgi:hypothetical protein
MLSDQLRSVTASTDRDFAEREREARVIAEQLDVLILDLLRALGLPGNLDDEGAPQDSVAGRIGKLEKLRDGTFDVLPTGELTSEVERLIEARLTPLRADARRAATDLVNEALRERKRVDSSRLLDEEKLHEAAKSVIEDAGIRLKDRVQIVVRDSSADLRVRPAELGDIDGAAGEDDRRWGRAIEIASTIASVGLMFAEPFTAVVGYIARWMLKRFGRKKARAAEAERERTATSVRLKLCQEIDETFNDAEAKVIERCGQLFDAARGELLPPVVDNCIALRLLIAEKEPARHEFGQLLEGLPAAGAPAQVLADAARDLERQRFPGDHRAASKLWRGEDWIEDVDGLSGSTDLARPNLWSSIRTHADRHAARRRFAAAWVESGARPAPRAGREWLAAATAALQHDSAAEVSLNELHRLPSGLLAWSFVATTARASRR